MKKRIIIIGGIIILAVVAFISYRVYASRQTASNANANIQTVKVERGTLTAQVGASGTVRANQSAMLTWQSTGTIDQVKVAVGDKVTRATELATLLKSSLSQNLIVAQSDLVTAQESLDNLLNSKLQQAKALQSVENAQKALDDLNNPAVRQAQAQLTIANAQKAVADATTQLSLVQSTAGQTSIEQAQAQVILAQNALNQAQDRYAPYANKPENNLIRANLLSQLATAQQNYDHAVANLNSLQSTGSTIDVAVAQANLANAQAQLAQAIIDGQLAQAGPTQGDIAVAQAQLADSQRAYERIKNGPNPSDVAAAQARIDAAQATINQAHVAAPFDGIVTQAPLLTGDQVTPGTVAFRLDDLSHLYLDIQVSEVDINQVQVDQPVTLAFDAILGMEYHGKVTDVASVGETIAGVVNFNVTVELTDADSQVKPGMSASATITVSELQNVLIIPNRAVQSVNSNRQIYIMRNGVPTAVQITLGKSSDTQSQVLTGDVLEGDLVVINPSVIESLLTRPAGMGGGGPFGGGGLP
jgi:HlyD family secretion protein